MIITDSLSMAATTKALGIKLPAAAVRALKAGADLALFASGDPDPVIDAVTAAIRSGRLPRAQAEATVLRVLELKRKAGLAPVSAEARPYAVDGRAAVAASYTGSGGSAGTAPRRPRLCGRSGSPGSTSRPAVESKDS